MGYLNNPKATEETYDSEGFLHTGDIGSMTDGLLMIQDRLKEMIKVKGIATAPAELEDLLLGHPLVADAAVIGILDDYAGELPKAFVVTKEGTPNNAETVDSIQKFVRERRNRNKWLAGGVEFMEQIPKTASGKILRRQLRDQERAKLQAQKAKAKL
jgi:4-coumarate--CoA ligase